MELVQDKASNSVSVSCGREKETLTFDLKWTNEDRYTINFNSTSSKAHNVKGIWRIESYQFVVVHLKLGMPLKRSDSSTSPMKKNTVLLCFGSNRGRSAKWGVCIWMVRLCCTSAVSSETLVTPSCAEKRQLCISVFTNGSSMYHFSTVLGKLEVFRGFVKKLISFKKKNLFSLSRRTDLIAKHNYFLMSLGWKSGLCIFESRKLNLVVFMLESFEIEYRKLDETRLRCRLEFVENRATEMKTWKPPSFLAQSHFRGPF